MFSLWGGVGFHNGKIIFSKVPWNHKLWTTLTAVNHTQLQNLLKLSNNMQQNGHIHNAFQIILKNGLDSQLKPKY